MRPPRRSRKTLTPFTPNSAPEGLNPRNEAPTFKDERETRACDAFNFTLRDKGWIFRKRGREDWSFIPASLLKTHPIPEIFRKGIEGVHYACGWKGLADMLDEYGEEYSPTNLEPPRRVSSVPGDSPQKLDAPADADADGDTLIEASQSVAYEGDENQGNEQEELMDGDDGEAQAMADEESDTINGVQIKQEDDEEDSSSIVPDNSSLLTTLECLKKCREELTWLENHPGFHGQDTELCKDHMHDTIANLYSQVCNYNETNSHE